MIRMRLVKEASFVLFRILGGEWYEENRANTGHHRFTSRK